jgi:hypothetical protein
MMSMNLRSGQCLPKPRVSLIRMIVTLAVLASVSSFSFPAYADLVFPTTTYVYFTRDGEPHDKPVDFTINCYGYWTYDKWRRIVDIPPGTYTPELVFSFSATCPEYGCEIYEPYYLNYRHIDYCDCVGETEGEAFVISNYGSSPVDFSKCGTQNDGFTRECELRLDIPVSSELTDSEAVEESTDSDEGGGGGGCFVTTAVGP